MSQFYFVAFHTCCSVILVATDGELRKPISWFNSLFEKLSRNGADKYRIHFEIYVFLGWCSITSVLSLPSLTSAILPSSRPKGGPRCHTSTRLKPSLQSYTVLEIKIEYIIISCSMSPVTFATQQPPDVKDFKLHCRQGQTFCACQLLICDIFGVQATFSNFYGHHRFGSRFSTVYHQLGQTWRSEINGNL
jgi:hypothetical protein